MIFHVLGPLEAHRADGTVLELGTRKSGTVLAVLLLHPNAWVDVDQLMAATWHEQAAPMSAESNLKTYVCQLRRTLGVRIDGRPGAYRLRVSPGDIDAGRAHDLADRAREAGDPATAATLLEDALALWRGRPFGGLTFDEASTAADRLDDLRRDLTEALAEAKLALGLGRESITMLRALTAQDALREGAWALLVRALHDAGRPGEALATYRRARAILADELGVEPGAALTAAHRQVLAAGPPAAHPRRELPGDVAGFTGREAELAAVRRFPRCVPVVIDGMAGAGKTAFAVHTAHSLADRFPDGQLFVDLRGGALAPGDALARLLRGIGIDSARPTTGSAARSSGCSRCAATSRPCSSVPADLDERAALWRSELAGRRILLVLDDAGDERQVRPLLPGTPSVLTLITTRDRGWRLQDEHRIELSPLNDKDSARLFHRAAGERATAAVLHTCGGLPGALLAVAARLRTRPLWTMADLDRWLAEESGQLLDLTPTYDRLDASARDAFHALGTLPADFDGRLAAQHVGTWPGETRRLLDELVDLHLLDAPAISRYRSHPLVRAQALRLAGTAPRSTGARVA